MNMTVSKLLKAGLFLVTAFGAYAQTCPGGIEGISANHVVCCPLSCGSCGGAGCSSRPGGASACCGGGIKATEMYCDETNEAPCIVGSRPAGMCPGDIEGISANDVVCCPLSCGSCGGAGCRSRPGGASACCGGGVKANDMYCDETNEAPCIVGSRPDSSSVDSSEESTSASADESQDSSDSTSASASADSSDDSAPDSSEEESASTSASADSDSSEEEESASSDDSSSVSADSSEEESASSDSTSASADESESASSDE